MASLRDTLNCIGVNTSGSISVLKDFFGFLQGRVPDDVTAGSSSVSVLQLMQDLKGKHFHINVIRTGIDLYDATDLARIDFSIYRIRQIYRPQSLSIGRVLHWDITTAQSNGLHNISDEDDATQLTRDWTVDNDGQDVFMVVSTPDGTNGFVGISNIDGPCDKDSKSRNGSIVGLDRNADDDVARTFAHEIGHYLGLSHQQDHPENLMCQTSLASSIRNSVVLTNSQGSDIRDHCSVKNGC
jgi:hypothetical protein